MPQHVMSAIEEAEAIATESRGRDDGAAPAVLPTPLTPDDTPTDGGITTSAPVTSELDGLDQTADDLGLEMADDEAAAALFEQKRKQRQEQYEANQKMIEQQRKERLEQQGQANAAMLGESRAALAALGILSSEPGLVSASSAQTYIDDVKTGNQREIDNLNAEMDSLLRAAKSARDSGDLQDAQDQINNANELRKERNNLRIQASQEARQIREAERKMKSDEFDKWLKEKVEKRAEETFTIGKAQDALAILEKSGFEDFADYSPSEITTIEQNIGLPDGTLANYAANAAKLQTLEGWSSTIQTDKSTGEVKAVYYRINPDTKEIETMDQSFGNIGNRFAPKAAPTPSSDNTEGINWAKSAEVTGAVTDMNAQLKTIIGSDGFVSPDDYTKARNAWIEANGSPTVFDTKFKGFRNPNNSNYVTEKE